MSVPEYIDPEQAQRAVVQEMTRRLTSEGAKPSWRKRDGLDPENKLDDFIRYVFGLEPARHHRIWIDAIQAMDEPGSNNKLMIISPPGHAKTTITGIAYPAWRIGKHPERHFLYYSNTSTQAEKQSVAIRDLVESDLYQSVFPVSRSATKGWGASRWYLEREDVWDKDPTMLAIGIDGPALGARADEFIFDDICDPENMNTQQSRKKVRTKVESVAFSRQGGQSRKIRMLAIMTRWHQEDIAEYFEDEGFDIIWMPALGYWEYVRPQEPVKSLRSDWIKQHIPLEELELGEALWPEEYPKNRFDNTRKNSRDTWLLEYQGLTVAAGGNRFRDDMFVLWGEGEDLKELDTHRVQAVIQFWDSANTENSTSDFWVCETWAVGVDGYYLLDTYMSKHVFSAGTEAMKSQFHKRFLAPDGTVLVPQEILVETTGSNNGEALIDVLGQDGYPISGISTNNIGKEDRAEKAIAFLKTRPFYFTADDGRFDGTTFHEFIGQHLGFPRERHDDMVDATVHAVCWLTENYPVDSAYDIRQGMATREEFATANRELERARVSPRNSLIGEAVSRPSSPFSGFESAAAGSFRNRGRKQ